ncbi:MAG: acyl-CoA thioesterase [Pseudoxanthomonas sp.]
MTSRSRSLTLQFLAEPTDVNYGGKVHGGAVMKWIDQAGFAAAVSWSGSYCVTVAVGGIRFVAPISISNLVAVSATLVRTGRTSMQFVVEVRARSPLGGEDKLCTHCIIVFVAVDRETGSPVEVPHWEPENEEDRHFFEYAEKVMTLSKSIEDTVARYTGA